MQTTRFACCYIAIANNEPFGIGKRCPGAATRAGASAGDATRAGAGALPCFNLTRTKQGLISACDGGKMHV